MIIIEDLSKEIIELLGSSLDLDPIFFAGHLHTAWENRQAQTPHQCSLPSQAQRQNFVNIHYHRVIDFDDVEVPAKQILRYMNIDRKVVIYPISEGKRIGMVQHCTSVLLSRKGLSWLG